MNFRGEARPLTDSDVRTIAGYLGCEIAALKAVMAIEAAGKGFHDGRPVILFEPHAFYRELGAGPKLEQAKAHGLAYAKWGTRPYPRAQFERYAQLADAMSIAKRAALRSTSYGAMQVMGFNHKACGFDTVEEFVEAMTVSEGAHLYAGARFIVSKGLQRHLRAKNWSSFAKGYNGSGYAKNGYHTKLRAAYEARPRSERVIPPPASESDLKALYSPSGTPPAPPDVEPLPHKPETKAPGVGLAAGIALAFAGAVGAILNWFGVF